MKKLFEQNRLLGSLTLPVLLASVGTSMANVALPAISSDFGVSFSQVRWVVLGYLWAATLLSLAIGRIADVRGRRRVLLAGVILFLAATFLCGMAPSFWILIFARVVQGIGGAALVTIPIAIVTGTVPREKTGRAIGLLATMSAIGTASGPSIGGFLLAMSGWRSAFFMMTILAGLSAALLLKFVPSDQGSGDRNREGDFFRAVRAVANEATLRSQLISNFIVSTVMMSTLIAGPFYLTRGLHLAPAHMGLVMSAGPITSVFFGIFSGLAVDRFGSGAVIRFGLAQLLIGASSFVLLPSLFGAAGFAFSAVLLSLGYQIFLAANSSRIMQDISADRRGLVSGVLSLSRNLGLICGAFVMGSIFGLFAKASDGLRVTFLVAAVLIAFLLVISLKNQKRRNNETRLAS